jgi:CrcB protein
MIGLLACVAAGGALGTLARFGVSQWVNGHWPQQSHLATLLVNLLGCLLIGYLYGLFLSRPDIPLEVRAGLTVGVLGGLTTFSTFSLDTLRLLEGGQLTTAFGYLACSVLGGLLATWAGLSFARL